MPRQARLDAPGALQHVMARGIERRKIFWDDKDRKVPEVGNRKSEVCFGAQRPEVRYGNKTDKVCKGLESI
jgi:hypothetical protein